eukprot:964421-Alexandrium_andersonii.AAC.1
MKVALQDQAAIVLCAVSGVSKSSCHALTGRNHKLIESLYTNLDKAKADHVKQEEKRISFGGQDQWVDVEADEVDVRKAEEVDSDDPNPVTWEQWAGVVQRGNKKTLKLFRLSPKATKKRAPGPGPIRKSEWKAFAQKHLGNRNIILHTDGARAYKLKVEGMLHDHVVHMKKQVVVDTKKQWVTPKYTK